MDDQPMREKRAILPHGHAKLGTLSPAFSSTDEVARYLHGRVGTHLKVEYGSAILRRLADGLYVGSEPISDRPTVFNFDLLLDSDPANTRYLDPEGYQIVASWHTHPDSTAWVARENPTWTAHQITAYQGFYSEPDIIFNYQNRPKFREAFLSGPDGTLIKYQFDETEAALGFAHWITTRGRFESPHAFDGTIEGLYKKVASVGQLTFLISSPYWGGSTGRVPANWEPYKPWPVFADRAPALARASAQIQRQPNLRQQALILLSDALTDYVARDPDPIEGLAGELPQLPIGYHLHGIYVHSRPLPFQYPTLESWLYKNFISPLELAQHIARFRQYSLGPQSTLGASLFIRMRDEAILRYRFSGSALESQLFAQAPDGQVIDNGWQAALLDGSLLTRDFVRKVAAAGELSVEKTSALWDRSGAVDATWLPYSRFNLASLNGAFLTADDAARYIHTQINGQRVHALGGLILKRQDGRFEITQPTPCGSRPFAFDGYYPRDRQGMPMILYPGMRLHGLYASRPALSSTDPSLATRFKWTRREAELNAQMFEPQDVADLLSAGVVGYLSGSSDCLIALGPTTAQASWVKQWQAVAGAGYSPIGKQMAEGLVKPADVVRSLAEGGTLRVLQGNDLWGPRGFVELDWGPWVRIQQFERPVTVSHGALFRTADDAALSMQRADPQDYGERFIQRYFGFILKHETREEYVASELIPVTAKSPLLSFASLYGSQAVEGFACQSLFYSRPWSTNGAKAWLQRFFIDPADLHEAIAQARLNAYTPPHGAPVYVATPEGALLCYRSASTRAMFETLSDADSLETTQTKLDIGTLLPSQFVRRVASSGELRVVRASHCWDRVGTVSGLWVAYNHLQRRRLSPAFLSMDDAAYYVRRRVPLGLAQGYGGIILRRDDGWFVVTEPVRVPDEVFDIKWIFPDDMVNRGLYPQLTSVVASYHSRPVEQWPFLMSPAQSKVYGNMFSTRFLAHALAPDASHQYHYLLAPDGALLRLKSRELKYPLITSADLVTHPRYRHQWLSGRLERQLRSGELTPNEYVNRVAGSFELQVMVGSPMWGGQGQVTAWSAFTQETSPEGRYAQARQDPVCSPVHIQIDDAARYAHEQVLTRDETQFGYVMQSIGNGHFVATLPVSDADSNLDHRRIFADAGYPHRYKLSGMYLCAPRWEDFHPGIPVQDGDSIYQGLVSPLRLITAMYQTGATAKRSALPLYLSCADGALLKFTVRDQRFVQYKDHLELKLRRLSPRDYIRRMAAAGELRVLVPSVNWPGVGVVDALWQPERSIAVASDDNTWALGPIHAHRDDAAVFNHLRAGSFGGRQALSALLEKTSNSGSHVPVLALADNGFPSDVALRVFPQTRASEPAQWPMGYQVSAAQLVFHAGLDQLQLGVERSYCEYFVSWRELGFYLHHLKQRKLPITGFYLTARDGALLSYTPTFSQAETDLLKTDGKWTTEKGYTSLAPKPSYVLSELARLGQLRVLRSGTFWTANAQLDSDLRLPGSTTERSARDEL